MKPKKIEPSRTDVKFQSPDRLTRILMAAVFVLIAIVVALGADLLLNSGAGEPTPRAAHLAPSPTAPPVIPTASPLPVTPPSCVPPQDWVIHAVREGDTLYSLAQRYGTDVEALTWVNCLEADTILIGQELYVPGPPVAPTTSAPVAATSRALSAVNFQASFPDRFTNIILLGSDKRQDNGSWRTDTMIVVSVDTEDDFVRLLSIPRDLWVKISGHSYDRINTVDLWGEMAGEGGGAELVKQVIYESLGIPIHYYVRADFEGFVKIVDAVGGLDIDVECPLPDIELMPGVHHMDGQDALRYARSRKSTNDFDRNRRQRKILMALWEQALTVDLIPRLPALWTAMADTFQTDLPLDQVISLAYVGLQLEPNQILSQSIGPRQVENWITPDGASVLLPRHNEIQELLSSFYSPPDMEFLEKISQTRIQVLNGSQHPQSGLLVATALGWAGFQVTSADPVDSQNYAETRIIVHNADAGIAQVVARQLELLPAAIQYQSRPAGPVDIQVILGWDYDPCADK